MTNNGSNSRLDQIEALQLETQQLVKSNAVAIQALTDDLVTFKLTTEQNIAEARAERQELRAATIRLGEVADGIASKSRPSTVTDLPFCESFPLSRIKLT